MAPLYIESIAGRFRSSANPCIFIGAGVSHRPPTDIPLFGGLREAYLQTIDPGDSILERHAGDQLETVATAIRNLHLESFFSSLVTALGPAVFAPFQWMSGRPLNAYHYLLRRIAEALPVKTILTTNFDTLLERALPGFQPLAAMKSGYRGQSERSLFPKNQPAIIYLHGRAGSGSEDITLAGIARPFDRLDYANLTERLRDATLLVIGYGGGDITDIVPFLTTLNIHELIWIGHHDGDEAEMQDVPEIWYEQVSASCVGVRCDTSVLLRTIAGEARQSEDALLPGSFADEVRHALGGRLNTPVRHYLLANFVNMVGYGDIAASIFDACPEPPEAAFAAGALAVMRARAIAMSRSSDPARHSLARIQLRKAVEMIPRMNAKSPDFVRECGLAYESLGILHYEDGDIEEALRCCDRAREFFTDDEDLVRLTLNQTAFRELRTPDAIVGEEAANRIREYETLADADLPKDQRRKISLDLASLGESIFNDGRSVGLSIQVYELALRFDPDAIGLYVDLSSLRRLTGDLRSAMDIIEHGLARDERAYQLLCNQGYLLNEMGRQREAKPVLLRAIDINPNDPLTWNNLGKCYGELGELQDARAAYINAIVLDPSFTEARYNLERLEVVLGKRPP